MTKQEEIRKVINSYPGGSCLLPDKYCNAKEIGACQTNEFREYCLMERLSDLGVVLKVERELPVIGAYFYEHEKSGYKDAQQDMLEAGFTAWEPLDKVIGD